MVPILALRHRKMIVKIDHFCRKQTYSVNTPAVVGGNLMILDLATGYLGRFYDSRVLRNSNIFQMAKNSDVLLCQKSVHLS